MAGIRLECVRCGGGGCESCRQWGYTLITCCPQKFIDRDVREFIQLAELCAKGLPPVLGGSLDQTAAFLDGYHYYQSKIDSVSNG